MHAPTLAERSQPGLSATLEGPRDPRRCQSCGASHSILTPLARWLEHDEWDRVPDRPGVVVLCRECSDRLIEPHARLYRQLDPGEPFPGCMSVCLDCVRRDGTSCTSLVAKLNGGPGLDYEHTVKPMWAHIDGVRGGRRFGETRWLYTGRVLSCSGKETV